MRFMSRYITQDIYKGMATCGNLETESTKKTRLKLQDLILVSDFLDKGLFLLMVEDIQYKQASSRCMQTPDSRC